MAYNIYMPKRTNRSILIDSLLKIIANEPGISAQKLTEKASQNYSLSEITSALRYMKYNQLIFDRFDRGLSVSNKAKIRLASVEVEQLFITKPKKWDKKWRLVIFEIPHAFKTKRDAFSNHLGQLGFIKLKDSVYVHPFHCQNETEKLAAYYKLQKYVTYLESSKLITTRKLEKEFKNLLS